MQAKKRRIDPGLIERLQSDPHRFEFFQAVRLLVTHYKRAPRMPEQDVLGQLIRFRSSISLAFPPSEIETLEFHQGEGRCADGEENAMGLSIGLGPVTLTPSFIGLTGPMGVMPRHYTQHVAEREIYHRDTAMRAFLDIFTNRAVTLFYQSWLRSRLHLQYENDSKSRFLPQILSLAGLGLSGLGERHGGETGGIADESLAYYAGALRDRPRTAQRFAQVAADYFQVRFSVEQFVGCWFDLPERERTVLGTANCELGKATFCGSRVWDRQGKMRLILGPLRKRQFDAFLPGGSASGNLRHLYRLMVGVTIDCEVRLILDQRDVASAALGNCGGNTRLGWNSWLAPRPTISDSHDVCYLLEDASS